ncbi:hypothetical protein IFM89_024910, partial [Coptis chinensis]
MTTINSCTVAPIEYRPNHYLWVKDLAPKKLEEAAARKIKSVVLRYKGEVIAWDVDNENLHFSFFEERIGHNASAVFFYKAHELDPEAITFMNDYNTIEFSNDILASLDKYIQKIRQIQAFWGNKDITEGIGLRSHFSSGQPNLPYMKASLDKLASTGLPIWLADVDVAKHPNQ